MLVKAVGRVWCWRMPWSKENYCEITLVPLVVSSFRVCEATPKDWWATSKHLGYITSSRAATPLC